MSPRNFSNNTGFDRNTDLGNLDAMTGNQYQQTFYTFTNPGCLDTTFAGFQELPEFPFQENICIYGLNYIDKEKNKAKIYQVAKRYDDNDGNDALMGLLSKEDKPLVEGVVIRFKNIIE